MKKQGGCSEGLQKAPMQPASPAFFEHHSQKTFCESVRFFANNVPVCRIVIETVTKALKRIKLFYFGIYIKKITKKDGTIVSDIGQPLALGGITDGVTNLELNAGYAAIANQGTYIKPKLYTKIVDHDGNILIDNTAPESTQVIKESTAFFYEPGLMSYYTTSSVTCNCKCILCFFSKIMNKCYSVAFFTKLI